MTGETFSEDDFRNQWKEQADEIGRFNLAIFGKTGVGKSTLINAIFGEEVAPTGVGDPVTMDEHLYIHRSGFLGLLDTRGLEIGKDTDELIRELGDYLKKMRQRPLSEQIHVAWYCVRATDRRFEDTEAEFIRRLHELGLPVVAVLTQVPSRNGEYHADALTLADHIAGLDLPIVGGRPILVMSTADEFTGQVQHGLTELVDATFRAAPEGVEAAFAAAQKVDLARKRKQAQTAVRAAATAALTVGAIPIPVADAGVLIPIQLGMIGEGGGDLRCQSRDRHDRSDRGNSRRLGGRTKRRRRPPEVHPRSGNHYRRCDLGHRRQHLHPGDRIRMGSGLR